jgi:acetyl esterase
MLVTLDPDAAAVFKAFQEADRPAYETLTATEAREFYMQARLVSNPEPPELNSAEPLSILASRRDPGAHLHAEDAQDCERAFAMPGIFSRWRLGDRQSRDS